MKMADKLEADQRTIAEASGNLSNHGIWSPENMDPLGDFWKKREHLYPRLAILAKKYLAVQSTSSPSERVVSKLNNVVSKKRNRITPSHTNETIFLSKRL